MTTVDFSTNLNLKNLDLTRGTFNSLDLSFNNQLQGLSLESNSNISILDLNNNNINLGISINSCPNLYCVDVDDPVYSTNNWTQIDPWTSFSSSALTAFLVVQTH